ncbi:SCO0930 family lipoprotein [Streptomyces capillispiralis]|uniref:Secreted repeat protein with Y-X4-D motif n=1 Tax=Streptomyces capillispiralis TaxID=68182 RepID=A0A561SGT8_9ACTN|nr:SCO0930 family lipoprotein [Streptomyces capillispiralis]TWF74081.1 secreted repeat protein with Y-X4-D motif [Streptomyces capillispiralis]GHH96413.1 lipoprotein [Streptomyces capillispiralis]
MSSRRLAAAALTVLAMSVTTACGGSDDGSDASGAPSPAASQERLADQGPAPVGDRTGPAGQLTVANDPNLGPIITDASGFTLYRFTKDGPNPELSACDAACAKLWPPVPADGALAPAGVDDALLGAVTRGDGSRQLMFDGLPLYRYAKDAKPGQVAGEGVGKTWFASLPSDTVSSVQPGVDASGPSEEAPEGEAPPQEGEVGEEVLEALPGLSVVDDPELGEIVVDAKGRTLYRFVKDTDWPMTTACTGSCLDTWKPAALVEKNDVEGIDPKLVIPFNRPDGKKQQTLDCWPLYWFTGDQQPGDINGQGKDGKWFAVAPDGSLVKK